MQRIDIPAQQKWITKLLGFSFLVEYKKAEENKAADALSRRVSDHPSSLSFIEHAHSSSSSSLAASQVDAQFYLISFLCLTWLDILKDSYQTDSEFQHLLFALASDAPPAHFSLQNGLILYRNKVFLNFASPLKPLVLQHAHNCPLGVMLVM